MKKEDKRAEQLQKAISAAFGHSAQLVRDDKGDEPLQMTAARGPKEAAQIKQTNN